jgi:membrane-associated phospholipid phosphatase
MTNNPTLSHRAPILADIFVFSYPVYLLGLYSWGRIKKTITPKISALIIWANVAVTVIANLGIQFFIQKDRPNIVLGLLDQKHETVLHKFLPNSSFPSDHAGVSMSISIASILRGITHKDSKYIRFGIIGIIFSLIMCSARVMTAVHRPTDIIAGMIVGIIVPLILLLPRPYKYMTKIATRISQKI